MRYFLAVAEELHFTRAAEKLHVAQPALSQQIRQLEEEIGVKLLERTNRRVQLTEAGQIFRKRVGSAMEQLARASHDAGQAGRGESGTISIGFVSSAVCGALPDLLRRFRDSVPLANFELRELEPAEQLEQIRQHQLDIGMMHAVLEEPGLESIPVSRDRLIVAMPEGHSLARAATVPLKSLSTETILVPKPHAAVGFHELVVSACRAQGFVPFRLQPVRLLQTAVSLVAGGIGVALVPASFERNLQVRGVVYRPLAEPAPVAELVAVWRSDEDDPLVLRFQKEIRSILKTEEG